MGMYGHKNTVEMKGSLGEKNRTLVSKQAEASAVSISYGDLAWRGQGGWDRTTGMCYEEPAKSYGRRHMTMSERPHLSIMVHSQQYLFKFHQEADICNKNNPRLLSYLMYEEISTGA